MKFVGYQEGTRNYRFVDKNGMIKRSPNATFIEDKKQDKVIRGEKEVEEAPQPDTKEDDEDEEEEENEADEAVEAEDAEEKQALVRRSSSKSRRQVDFGPLVACGSREGVCGHIE